MDPKYEVRTHCSWLYWTKVCAAFVLEEDAPNGSTLYIDYKDAFSPDAKIHTPWDGTGRSFVLDVWYGEGTTNCYLVEGDWKAGDWFCVYSWDFKEHGT